MSPNRFYYDTEFNQYQDVTADGRSVVVLDLISIGIVDDKGRTYSAVCSEFNRKAAEANPFVAAHVLSQLPPESEWKTRAQIRKELIAFIGPQQAEFYYWWLAQDHFLFDTLISPTFLDTPKNFKPMHYNLTQMFEDMGSPRGVLPAKPQNVHDVLADARWTKDVAEALRRFRWKSRIP